MLFDTHAHLNDERFDEDRESLITSFSENGISYAFLTNTSSYRGASFTNSIGNMVHTAMSRVTEWPSDRDLFVAVPHEEDNTAATSDNNQPGDIS